MCSLVEIKNHDEIYIHYLSGERGNVQNITIVKDALKNLVIGSDNNNSIKEATVTPKNHFSDEDKDEAFEAKETSDRASSMESSIEDPKENAEDLVNLIESLEDIDESKPETRDMSTQIEHKKDENCSKKKGESLLVTAFLQCKRLLTNNVIF